LLNWRRDPEVKRRVAESRMRAQQLKRENALLDEKVLEGLRGAGGSDSAPGFRCVGSTRH